MSDSDKSPFADFTDFGKLVPGFDFLQNLTRQASASSGSGLPKMQQLGGWVAPTMNVEELDKRIAELKAVQFWLDQNATALKATIQALEVQKMTLATLQGMNVNMAEMARAFTVKMPEGMGAGASRSEEASPAQAPQPDKASRFSGLEVPDTSYHKRAAEPEPEPASAAPPAAEPASAPAAAAKDTASASAIDPLQWWGALTQQFQSIASAAIREAAARQPMEAGKDLAKDAVKTATDMADSASKSMAKTTSGARDFMAGALRGADAWPVPSVGKAGQAGKAGARGAGTSTQAAAKPSTKPSTKTATKPAAKRATKPASKPTAKKGTKAHKPAAAGKSSPHRVTDGTQGGASGGKPDGTLKRSEKPHLKSRPAAASKAPAPARPKAKVEPSR